MHDAKRSRKRKRRDRDRESIPTAEATGVQEAVSTGAQNHGKPQQAPNTVCNFTEYRGGQLCRLRTVNTEVDVSMEEALHFLFLAIITAHVKASARR